MNLDREMAGLPVLRLQLPSVPSRRRALLDDLAATYLAGLGGRRASRRGTKCMRYGDPVERSYSAGGLDISGSADDGARERDDSRVLRPLPPRGD